MRAASLEACGCFPTGRHYPGIAHLLRAVTRGPHRGVRRRGARGPSSPSRSSTSRRRAWTPRSTASSRSGIVIARGGEIVERKNWLVNPGRPIPKEASDVHKITDDDVKDAPPFDAVAEEIAAMLEGCVPAAYNAAFDRAFLGNEVARTSASAATLAPALRRNVDWVDPLVWARELQQGERSRALGEVAARLGIALENAHRASDDAEAALRVMLALGRDVRVPRTYGALVQEQRRLAMVQADERRLNKWRLSASLVRRHCGAAPAGVLTYSAAHAHAAEDPVTDKAIITLGDTKLEAPVIVGTEDERAIDIGAAPRQDRAT